MTFAELRSLEHTFIMRMIEAHQAGKIIPKMDLIKLKNRAYDGNRSHESMTEFAQALKYAISYFDEILEG